ncbi:MAG: efflux RND transporter periplasmic adaptor subunit [Gammaproteobacteria bacterium]
MSSVERLHQSSPSKPIHDTSGQDIQVESSKPKFIKWILIAVVGVAVIAAVVVMFQRFASAEKSIPMARVSIAEVSRGDFTRDVSSQGVVVAAVSPGVFAPTSGVVTLLVNAGDSVEKDQVIARVANPALNNSLKLEESTLARIDSQLGRRRIENKRAALTSQQRVDLAKVELTATKRELRRAEASWEKQVISRQDHEKAIDEVSRSEISLGHAQRAANLELESLDFELNALQLERDRQALIVADTQRQVDALKLRAPVAGVVGNLAVIQKASISRDALIANIVDLGQLEVELLIPSSYSGSISAGSTVVISYSGKKHIGILKSVSPEIENNSVTARVTFGDSTPDDLRQNQRVSAQIILEQRDNVLKVRRGAFLDSSRGRFVFVVQEDGIAARRFIESGASSVDSVEIVSGLQVGDRIIVSSYDDFIDYDTIRLSN